VLARDDGVGGFVRRHLTSIRVVALPIVIGSVIVVRYGWWFDPTAVPQPKLFFLLSKSYDTPPRIIQFLALIAVVSAAYPLISKFAGWLVDFLSMLGRNSLYVFCVGSVLSLAGQIVRYIYRGDIVVDTLVVVFGIAIMAVTAWLPEWRESLKSRQGADLAPSS
jgi:hypothetical protein